MNCVDVLGATAVIVFVGVGIYLFVRWIWGKNENKREDKKE